MAAIMEQVQQMQLQEAALAELVVVVRAQRV
jgi:hypothetical protein